MTRIYFDESGQTGTHLFDPEQPYFCLCSTDIPEDEASEILRSAFPRQQGAELKAQKLLKRSGGRRQFLQFAKAVGERPKRFCVAKIGKRYAVVSKMVDFLVEPLLSAQGYDFYQDNYAYKFANSVGFVFEHILDRSLADRLLHLYNEFARQPDIAALRNLETALTGATRDAPHGAEVFLPLLAEGAREFENLHDLDSFEDTNDIHVTAAVSCMGHWQAQGPGPFDVVHDESLHFFARSERWQRITDPTIEPVTFKVGDKTLTMPIPVTSTTSARSHESSSLQLCDLIAGLISRASGSSDEFRRFVLEAIEAGLGEVAIFPVDFGTEFAAGPPARSTGPDIIDQIMRVTRRRHDT